jgi:hypothetical protein
MAPLREGGAIQEIITALSRIKMVVRHRPKFEVHLQGPSDLTRCSCSTNWAMSSGALCDRLMSIALMAGA